MPEESISVFVERFTVDEDFRQRHTDQASKSTPTIAGAAILLCLSVQSLPSLALPRSIFPANGAFQAPPMDRLRSASVEVKRMAMDDRLDEDQQDHGPSIAALKAFKIGAALMGGGLTAAAFTVVMEWSILPFASAMTIGVGALVAAAAADRYRSSLA